MEKIIQLGEILSKLKSDTKTLTDQIQEFNSVSLDMETVINLSYSTVEEKINAIGSGVTQIGNVTQAGVTLYNSFANTIAPGLVISSKEIQESFTTVNTAIEDISSTVATLTPVVGEMKTKFDETKTSTQEFSKASKRFISSAKGVGKAIVAFKTKSFKAGMKGMTLATYKFAKRAPQALSALGNVGANLRTLGSAMSEAGSTFAKSPIGQKLQTMLDPITKKYEPIISKVKEFASTTISAISQTFTVIDSLNSSIESVKNTVTNIVPIMKNKFKSLSPVMSAVGQRFSGVKSIFANSLPFMSSLVGKVGSAFLSLGKVFARVGMMFLTNPIGIAVAAIAGAAYLIYSNWGTIKDFFSNMWSGITTVFTSAWTSIKEMFSFSPLALITENFGAAFDWLSSKFEWITGLIPDFGGIAKGLTSGIKSIGSGIVSFFSGGDDKEEKQAANSTTYKKKVSLGNGLKKATVATAAATQLASASPATAQNTNSAIQQTNHIQVTVNNPTSNVDVQKAVTDALNENNNRGLGDDLT